MSNIPYKFNPVITPLPHYSTFAANLQQCRKITTEIVHNDRNGGSPVAEWELLCYNEQ